MCSVVLTIITSIDSFLFPRLKTVNTLLSFRSRKYNQFFTTEKHFPVEMATQNKRNVVYKKAYDTRRAGRILARHQPVNKITKIQIIGCRIIQ